MISTYKPGRHKTEHTDIPSAKMKEKKMMVKPHNPFDLHFYLSLSLIHFYRGCWCVYARAFIFCKVISTSCNRFLDFST